MLISSTYFHETGPHIFLEPCQKHRYKLCHNSQNFLSIIFIFFENLLFKSLHRQFVRFSPNSSHLQILPAKRNGFNVDKLIRMYLITHCCSRCDACCHAKLLLFWQNCKDLFLIYGHLLLLTASMLHFHMLHSQWMSLSLLP